MVSTYRGFRCPSCGLVVDRWLNLEHVLRCPQPDAARPSVEPPSEKNPPDVGVRV